MHIRYIILFNRLKKIKINKQGNEKRKKTVAIPVREIRKFYRVNLQGHGSDKPQKGVVQIPARGLMADDSHDFRSPPPSRFFFRIESIFGAFFINKSWREERKKWREISLPDHLFTHQLKRIHCTFAGRKSAPKFRFNSRVATCVLSNIWGVTL